MAEEKWESGRAREMDRERDGERERERERVTDGFPFNRPSIPSERNISFDPIPESTKNQSRVPPAKIRTCKFTVSNDAPVSLDSSAIVI